MKLDRRTEATLAFMLTFLSEVIPNWDAYAEGFRMGIRDAKLLVEETLAVMSGTRSLEELAKSGLATADRGQIGGRNIVGYFVAILVAGIVGVAVTVPIMQDVIAQANLTGTTATIASFIPTLLLVVFVVYVISPITGQ